MAKSTTVDDMITDIVFVCKVFKIVGSERKKKKTFEIKSLGN